MDRPISRPTAMQAMPANSFSRPSKALRSWTDAPPPLLCDLPAGERVVPLVVEDRLPLEAADEARGGVRTADCLGLRRDPGPYVAMDAQPTKGVRDALCTVVSNHTPPHGHWSPNGMLSGVQAAPSSGSRRSTR